MTWLTADACDIDELVALTSQAVDPSDYPFAHRIEHGAVVYEAGRLRRAVESNRRAIMSEMVRALLDGPGIVAFVGAFEPGPVDAVTAAYEQMIVDERSAGVGGGDHFAKPGANDRVWNTIEKLALRAPEVFADYYANDLLALVCESWLGFGYQITAQVNVVNPGGEAQAPHRDYHLGFMTDAQAERFPAHVHRLSPALTLQGAVAHCDMPVETGPTRYLPHSQKYEPGYLAWRRPEFKQYFAERHVQIPLAQGDAVFFNPALFHAAGTNVTTDVRRMANLLQISSAFGRAMEDVDRREMSRRLLPVLIERHRAGTPIDEIRRVIASSTEGYAFPGDLDVDQPLDGLAPESDAVIMERAVVEGWTIERLNTRFAESGQR